jgi:glycosyltransferase involved in cell wall biosynthesis
MARVDVVLPTFNRPDFLVKAIRSVLDQTHQDFQLIVVDDFSVQNSEEIVRSFQDERIKFYRHDTQRGEGGARNTGIINSRSEYIAFIDDDDQWEPEKLKLQLAIIEDSAPDLGLVYTSFEAINGDKIVWRKIATSRGYVYHDMLRRNLIGATSTVLVKRACIDRVGLFNDSIPYGVDHDLWLRISRYYRIEYVAIPMVRYSVHPERLSNNLDIVFRGFEERLNRYPECINEHSRYCSDQYVFFGAMFSLKGNLKLGRQLFLSALKLYPYSLRTYFNLILSFFGSEIYKKVKEMV